MFMPFIELEITGTAETYVADCDKCDVTLYTHKWAYLDHNERRDAMQRGRLQCAHCHGHADPDTFHKLDDHYAGRYSVPGYLDCTDWYYGTNKCQLERELRDYCGDELRAYYGDEKT